MSLPTQAKLVIGPLLLFTLIVSDKASRRRPRDKTRRLSFRCSRIHWSHPGPHSERRATDPRVVPRKVRFALDAGLSPVWVKSVRNARRESGTGSSDEGHRKRSRGTGPVGSLRTHRSGRPVPVRRLAPEQAQDVHRFLHTLSG
ncbi:hypothetical protein G6F68_016054 [Rhizopus microsporus]|nr:hypothetical protein G6F68_016054 [Rhizopus microsporus]